MKKVGKKLSHAFLKKRGFFVVEENYETKWGRIDLIARENNIIYFFKLKQVESLYELRKKSFNPQKDISRMVENYFIKRRIGNIEWRFCFLIYLIDLKNKKGRVRIYCF
ncbi:MAG: YraN family protein [Patescibacteria group bacterium]|nr:YraN family protein [Patescibacteria group bacterium]